MNRLFTERHLAVLALLAGLVCPATSFAQAGPSSSPNPARQFAALTSTELHGVVLDAHGQPLAGVVVSALGSTSAFAISDKGGRFTLRDLQSGPYLVRAHLQGYVSARARIVQVTSSASDITLALTRVQDGSDRPRVLQAGVSGETGDDAQSDGATTEDTSVIAWRLRHMPRSVLKDVDAAVVPADNRGSFMGGPGGVFSRAAETPVRLADFIAELPVNGEVNFLTTTSFDRPQDLFSMQGGLPSSVAFMSLTAPTASGTWAVRGGTTQGDLSSWIVAGSYSWQPIGSAHQYRTGMSYAVQRYMGSSADVLAAMADGRRNAGEMFAYDDWSIGSRVNASYGARYAHYDYLSHDLMLSPKASITVAPFADAELRVRGTVSRRVVAPGEEELELPSTGMWLPPGRTFSPSSAREGFRAEQINHFEIAAEQPLAGDVVVGLRAFRQHVDDQQVTTFGVILPDTTGANVGHYYVGNAGGVDAHGWGMSVSRTVTQGLHASVDYTQADAQWLDPTAAAVAGARMTPLVGRAAVERLRDLTTSVDSIVPYVDTHVFVIYKINSGFTPDLAAQRPQIGTRFDVQVTQALPFVKLSSSQWEIVIAVRNLFHEDFTDTSVFDELQVVRPPKHVLGGVTVHF
jgi:hypothetical protein